MTANPPHLFTLTGNLLAERTLEFEQWTAGRTHRARGESFQVGGKGINVAKMLHRLGAATTAVTFAGGPAGAECEQWLRAQPFASKLIPTTNPTRTGTVVRARGQPETTFLGVDSLPDAAAIRAAVDFLQAQASGSVLVVSGSLPGWESREFDPLRELFHRWPERGPLIVDTYGPPLAWFANEAASLVKINRTELETLFTSRVEKTSTGELLRDARLRFRPLRWAVTDGPAPVWFVAEHNDPETIPAPKVVQVSPTGSGDVMLACTLFGRYYRGLSWREAVAWSLPYAAANAAHPGIAEFPLPLPEP